MDNCRICGTISIKITYHNFIIITELSYSRPLPPPTNLSSTIQSCQT
ncbi:hypothetical protein [Fibrobacter sp. UWB12]